MGEMDTGGENRWRKNRGSREKIVGREKIGGLGQNTTNTTTATTNYLEGSKKQPWIWH